MFQSFLTHISFTYVSLCFNTGLSPLMMGLQASGSAWHQLSVIPASLVELAVGVRGLDGYLRGAILCPPNSNLSTAYVTTIYPQTQITPLTSPTPSYEEWHTHDRWVASVIVNNTEDPIGLGIGDDDSAAKIWFYLNKELGSKMAAAATASQSQQGTRRVCSNPVCGKLGHIIEMCWKKGGGAEGKGPKGWRYNKTNAPTSTSAAATTTTPTVTTASNVYIKADPSPAELYTNHVDTKPGMSDVTPVIMRSPDTGGKDRHS
ncbi:hypothetical protein BDP27DRAFT_1445876 [Rhodocollybia butyracea]|uniref:Uncharacterized protein n=1 Tax=Rhodocollybia butyracea TaxID=206335 RepID=A0A9P5U9I6_9AGAR|nr:hypothetical protein BDP27DRAFT_1445876 [Rhodocollybia butyracea]